MKKWYEALFENYGRGYDMESFTRGTVGECDFIEGEIGHDKSIRILDVGCGTGRHSIELSKRGYEVLGVDLSESMVSRARQKALDTGLKAVFEVHDARALPFKNRFELAIMLCEGGFPLMETDEMNYDILKSVTCALKSGGKFIFTTLNGLFPVHNELDAFHAEANAKGDATYGRHSFDLMTFRDSYTTLFEDDDGKKINLECNERYYAPSEITWLLKTLGYSKIEIFAAKLGAFSRKDKLEVKDFEMLVIAEKSADQYPAGI
jgi:SAM-dependent methyltransferase